MSHQSTERKLKVFLCHSSKDKPIVLQLYRRLVREGFEPWLDTKSLLPGQDWNLEIKKAVRASDAVLVCLSEDSVTKQGFIQKEIKYVLDAADEKPEGMIFILPLRLDECPVPDRLARWQWVDYSSREGFQKLIFALTVRAIEVGAAIRREANFEG